ncbi:uncharacterized protein AMSG_00433 [Thecamonas trahens ATCC 50062]|uniref:Nudix hydrolase domain-containing protein n=1 Tax=Thecamonas trahens ATCC 50062 TaxID=461836 RepID=A0A0L0D8V3_THETB|nr:hypothetical protein AMSG_00433 [Thecamonas trahens ATCC 50062]KNC48655.1 hypothetical protein AMSG_00433 [Thecamonas trahens ATCC 50062]|eukprot:XP_013762711.1 hypothetical protein AMSG_00433 [Thecamonas trahens ATCC 50062]
MAEDGESAAELAWKPDAYGGVLVSGSALPSDADAFAIALGQSLATWREAGKRGVWLRLRPELVHLAQVAIATGFAMHSASPEHLTLAMWLPDDTPSTLPPAPAFKAGIGGFVTHGDSVLVVQEANGPFPGFWKLPGGSVDPDEELLDAAAREVREETAIEAVAVGIVGSSTGRLLLVAYMPLDSEQPRPEPVRQASEIAAAQWMPIVDFLALDHVVGVYGELYKLAATQHAEWQARDEAGEASLVPPAHGGLIEANSLPIVFRKGSHTLLSAKL